MSIRCYFKCSAQWRRRIARSSWRTSRDCSAISWAPTNARSSWTWTTGTSIHSFVHSASSFSHSFINSVIHSDIRSFVRSVRQSGIFIRSCIHSVCPFVLTVIHLFVHLIHSFAHSFSHWCMRSFLAKSLILISTDWRLSYSYFVWLHVETCQIWDCCDRQFLKSKQMHIILTLFIND